MPRADSPASALAFSYHERHSEGCELPGIEHLEQCLVHRSPQQRSSVMIISIQGKAQVYPIPEVRSIWGTAADW